MRMHVTIVYQRAPGPKQIESVRLRVNTDDILSAVAEAITQTAGMTTVPITRLIVDVEQER